MRLIPSRTAIQGRGWPIALLAAAALLVAPAQAQLVTSGGDSATPADGEIRKEITDINTAGGGTLTIAVANVFISRGALPAFSGSSNVVINQDTTIDANGAAVFSGTCTNINSAGLFDLRFTDTGAPANITTVGGGAIRRVRVDGPRTGGITVNAGGNNYIMEAITMLGDRGGTGIDLTCNAAQLRGIAIEDFSTGGIHVTAANGVTITSLPQFAIVPGVFPAFRLHNYIGYRGNEWWNAASATAHSSDYNNGGIDGFPQIGGVGADIASSGNVTVNDTDIGNCSSHGLRIDPTGGAPAIRLRRLHVGVVPEGAREDFAANQQNPDRRISGDGIRIEGGRADVFIGSEDDADPQFAGAPRTGLNYTDDDFDDALNHEHKTGDLGISVGACRNGAGIRIGTDGGASAVQGFAEVRYVRSGLDATGTMEVTDFIFDQPTARRQQYGLYTWITGSSLTVDNSQFSGNTVRGVELNGTTRLAFTNNNVGLIADTTTVPYTSEHWLNGQRPAHGNGARGYFEGTTFPGSASGEGMRINTSDLIMDFTGNVISGSCTNGLVITSTNPGTPAPPIGSGGIGGTTSATGNDPTQDEWNHIGVQGSGREGGRVLYLGDPACLNATRGQKLVDTPVPGGGSQEVSDDAVGWEATIAATLQTPRVRGNGTTIFGNGGGTPSSATGSGLIYQGTGQCVIRGITISDSAEHGLWIDTPQGDVDANVTLTAARIGLDDTGLTPNDQSLGNGTVLRTPGDPFIIISRVGDGIRVSGDGCNRLGVGSDTFGLATLGERDRNVISSNAVYGVHLTRTVGTNNPTATLNAISNCRIGTNYDGTIAGVTDTTEARLGFGNGHQCVDAMTIGQGYPDYYGAGIRIEPNVTGRHLIGGDDTGNPGDPQGALPLTDTTTISERNIIAGNGLVGIWLLGEGSVCVANNYVGADLTGSLGINGGLQPIGLMIEQDQFSIHNVTNEANGSNNMLPQYIGRIPFSGLTNLNGDPQNEGGGPGDYGNLIVDSSLWGIAIEDDGQHSIQANHVGINAAGTAAIANGGGFPTALVVLLYPLSSGVLQTGGVQIGAFNPAISASDLTMGDDAAAAPNVISGNTGHGVAQYRSGHLKAVSNIVGLNLARDAKVPNSLDGFYIYGGGDNEILRSIISGNTREGIEIEGGGANQILGNWIGPGATGDETTLGNTRHGILVDTLATGSNVIGLDGSSAGLPRRNVISGNGLSGIALAAPGANLVRNNYIGTNNEGLAAAANGMSNTADDREGILITGTGNNTIGGSSLRDSAANPSVVAGSPGATPGDATFVNVDGNVISGNTANGVLITAAASGNNLLQGNLIGLNGSAAAFPVAAAYGTAALANGAQGISILGTSAQNTISGNVISGNTQNGVSLEANGLTTLVGNRVGTNRLGDAAVANLVDGVTVPTGGAAHRLGQPNSAAGVFDNGNLLSGNTRYGLHVSSAQGHEVYGNRIGTDLSGTVAVPNGEGIYSDMASGTLTIGGTLTGQLNVVSGNTGAGITLAGDAIHLVRGNRVGVDAGAGNDALGNGTAGIVVDAAGQAGQSNSIAENRVAGNQGFGIILRDGNNVLRLNRIGTNVAGDGPLTYPGSQPIHQIVGLRVSAPAGTTQTIGVATEGNVISGNEDDGVQLAGAGAVNLLSNLIGLNVAGGAAIPNGGDGLDIRAAATGAVNVGGTGANEQNSLSGNGQFGLRHSGEQAPVIVNNRIGTNANGSAAIGNSVGGVRFESTSAVVTAVTLGGASSGNVISGNGGNGVSVAAGTVHDVVLYGNRIGTNVTGAAPIRNNGNGVHIESGNAAENTIGGLQAGQGNVISGNGTVGPPPVVFHGIFLQGDGVTRIQGNQIGGDVSGAALAGGVGNTGDGIRIDRAGANGSLVEGNVIRDNLGSGIAVPQGDNEQLTDNLLIGNGVTRDVNNQVTALKLPIDIGADDAVGGSTNGSIAAPVLLRLVATSGGQATLHGTVSSQPVAQFVEIYRADDPIPTDAFDAGYLTNVRHHGGAAQLLTTVPVNANSTTFQATVAAGVGDLLTALARTSDGDTSEFSRNIGLISSANSTISASPTTLVADNSATSTVTVSLRDAIGTPIIGVNDLNLAYAPNFTGLVVVTPNPRTTDSNGQATGQLRSTASGQTTVTASTTSGVTLPTGVTINFTSANVDLTESTFTVDTTQVRSNGTDVATFGIEVQDSNLNPVPNQLVTIVASSASAPANPASGNTNTSGQYAATAAWGGAASATETVTYTAHLGDATGPVIGTPLNVTFLPSPIDASTTTLTANPTQLANDDTTTSTLTLTIRNVDGQAVSGVDAADVIFTTNAQAQDVTITETSTSSDSAGRFLATVRSSALQTVTITASVRGVTVNQTATVQFVAGEPASSSSTLTLEPSTAIADGTQTIAATVVVKDSQGQAVAGRPVTLVATPADGLTFLQPAATDDTGTAQGTLVATVAGTYQISALVGVTSGTITVGPKPAVFTVNPPDASRSGVTVAPAAIVADGAEQATITITLVDSQGRPLVGVQPNNPSDPLDRITVVAKDADGNVLLPADGVTVVQPTSASNSDGVTTATISGTEPVVATIEVTARGVLVTTRPTVTLRDFFAISYGLGTHFMGLPIEPLDPSPASIFAELLPGLRFARYRPSRPETDRYLRYVTGTTSTELDLHPGRGFWLQLNREVDLKVVGTPVVDGPFDLPTEQGWNQLANPYTGLWAFRLDQIQVLRNGSLVGTLAGTAGRELVDPYAWTWDPVLGYLLVLDPATAGSVTVPGTIPVGRGFWMNVKQPNVTLRLAGPTRSRAASGRARPATPREWMLSLTASVGDDSVQSNLMGVGASRLQAVLPPEGPVPAPVRLSFRDESGRAVATDVRVGPVTRATRWTAVVDAPADTQVTIGWPGASRAVPAGHRLWLVDPTNGRRVLMNTRAGYTYLNSGGSRELQIEVDPHGRRSLAVGSLAVKPGAGRSRGVPIEFAVSVPARVQVVIKGLRGTVVRTLECEASAGQNVLTWDRRDQEGRTIPAGVYQVELTATTDEGEIVRLTRTARVD